MKNNAVRNWFVERFDDLSPQLQALHTQGGRLTGVAQVRYSKNKLLKWFFKKKRFPNEGENQLQVCIEHSQNSLLWSRQFVGGQQVQSVFTPVGTIKNGYWVEKIGAITVTLQVDIVDGGWHWRVIEYYVYGLLIPKRIRPNVVAYKCIENGLYRFVVSVSLPMIGELFHYSGALRLDTRK